MWPFYLVVAILGGVAGACVSGNATGALAGIGIAVGLAFIVDVFNIKVFA